MTPQDRQNLVKDALNNLAGPHVPAGLDDSDKRLVEAKGHKLRRSCDYARIMLTEGIDPLAVAAYLEIATSDLQDPLQAALQMFIRESKP